MSILRNLKNGKSTEPFLWWYRSILINLKLLPPKSNATQSWFVVSYSILCFVPVVLIGGLIVLLKRILTKDKVEQKKFSHELVIAAIVKNEGDYIEEWLGYHLLIGVDKFIIYDNDSTDNLKEILGSYIDKGIVDYVSYPGQLMQTKAYTDAINRYKDKTKYLGFIDIDEFIVVSNGQSLKELLHTHFDSFKHVGGLAIQWYNFGTSGHKSKPEGLVIENYIKRGPSSFRPLIKTIGNPRMMECCVNPHFPIYKLGIYNKSETGKNVLGVHLYDSSPLNIHINHYFTKSEEECMAKFLRGRSDINQKYRNDFFKVTNRNDILDDEMLVYANEVKEIMEDLRSQQS